MEIAAQRYYEIVNNKHPIYKKESFKDVSEYEAWKELQLKSIKKLCSKDDLSSLLSEWKDLDYHGIISPLVSAMFLYDKQLDPKFIPSALTMDILDAVFDCFNFGSKKFQYLSMIKSLSGFTTSLSDCSLKILHIYQYILQFVNESLSNPTLNAGEQKFFYEVMKPVLNYVNYITDRFYVSKNEKMRQVIIMGSKISSLLHIYEILKQPDEKIKSFNEKTQEAYSKHLVHVSKIFKTEAFKEEFTPTNIILYIKAFSQYLDTCQIYFVDLFS
jgi:hypothetical protein